VAPALLPENPPMKVVERSAIVPYTPRQMFALVEDVASYPQFLPWCVAASVEQTGANERVASLRIARGVLRTGFTTRNVSRQDSEIMMHLVDGPFRALTGRWQFEAIGARGSRVGFRIEFAFNNALTAAALNAVFESLCGTIVDAFVQRAQKIYAE
jgi:ribosome-associated toxin RatA of RatAB toxin-antitoxin module